MKVHGLFLMVDVGCLCCCIGTYSPFRE